MHFVQARAVGHHAEVDVIERCQDRIPTFELTARNNDVRFDFAARIDGRPVTFECKTDLRAEATQNVAIEYYSRGKRSGIAATQADVWVCCIGSTVRMIATKSLRALLKAGEFRTVNGGDKGSGTKMFLVPLATFNTWGISL